MLESQNKWYCKIYLHYVKNINKVKMDYSLYELIDDRKDDTLKSVNSEERFNIHDFKKCKIGLVKKTKLEDGIHFGFIIGNETDDFVKAEKAILPNVKKYILPRLFFKPRFKEFFSDRVNQILSEFD